MKVSVAIPCYNGAHYISETIESVLRQSRPADEVLVIDDGSTDESASLIQLYPVTLIRHAKNLGLSAARNTAMNTASGDILAFIDVDAQADREWLHGLLNGYTHSDIGGVGGAGIEACEYSLSDRWRHRHASQNHGERPKDQVDFLYGLNMSFRREALRQVGGFCLTLRTNAEDMDMGFRLTQAGYRLVYRPEARVYHQRTDDRDSLRRTIYNWYFWAFLVKHKNRRNPWTLALGTLRRLLWSDLWPDLLVERNLKMAALDFEMALIKLKAVYAASQSEHIKRPW